MGDLRVDSEEVKMTRVVEIGNIEETSANGPEEKGIV